MKNYRKHLVTVGAVVVLVLVVVITPGGVANVQTNYSALLIPSSNDYKVESFNISPGFWIYLGSDFVSYAIFTVVLGWFVTSIYLAQFYYEHSLRDRIAVRRQTLSQSREQRKAEDRLRVARLVIKLSEDQTIADMQEAVSRSQPKAGEKAKAKAMRYEGPLHGFEPPPDEEM